MKRLIILIVNYIVWVITSLWDAFIVFTGCMTLLSFGLWTIIPIAIIYASFKLYHETPAEVLILGMSYAIAHLYVFLLIFIDDINSN